MKPGTDSPITNESVQRRKVRQPSSSSRLWAVKDTKKAETCSDNLSEHTL